jgi:hypothetical protein
VAKVILIFAQPGAIPGADMAHDVLGVLFVFFFFSPVALSLSGQGPVNAD